MEKRMYSCKQCSKYFMCLATMGRHGCSNICKDFNLVKENDDLVKYLVKEIRRQTIDKCLSVVEWTDIRLI